MLIQEKMLNEIIKNSTNIKMYSINNFGCYRNKQIYPDNITRIIDKLETISKTISYETNCYVEDSTKELNDVIDGLGDRFFNDKPVITVIFDENFAVEFGMDSEHLLYGDPTNKMTLDAFAIKDGKKLEDIKKYIDILERLFKL